MIPTTEILKITHAIYVLNSGMDIAYTMHHGYAWERFLQDFTQDDLALVCKFLRTDIRRPGSKTTLAALKFRNLIEDLPAFADHRAMALASATIRAKERARPLATATEKADAIRAGEVVPSRATGHPQHVSATVQGLLAKFHQENP